MSEVTVTQVLEKMLEVSGECTNTLQRVEQTRLSVQGAITDAAQARQDAARALEIAGSGGGSAGTDVNVKQNQSMEDAAFPILAAATANQSETATGEAIFATGIKINPSTGSIIATNFEGTATKANQDGAGNNIASTYATKTELSAVQGTIPDAVSAATVVPFAPASTAAVGSSEKYAREDHVHPLQTSVDTATKATKDGSGNTINDYYMPFTGGSFTGGFFGKAVDMGSASAINLANGSIFKKTISANTTFTVSGLPTGSCACFTLILTNGGSNTVTWFSGVKWPGGSVPTLTASGVDVLTFVTYGDNVWYGVASSQAAA